MTTAAPAKSTAIRSVARTAADRLITFALLGTGALGVIAGAVGAVVTGAN